MISEFILFFFGIAGIICLFTVLAHLSARMGDGLRLPGYYQFYFVAIFIMLLTVPIGWSVHYAGEKGKEDILFVLLIMANVIAVAASYKYWWWLKDELWIRKKETGER